MKALRPLVHAARLVNARPVRVVLVCGLLLTATLFFTVRSQEQERMRAYFERRATTRIAAIQDGLNDAAGVVATVNRLFVIMPPVSGAQFAAFTRPMLEKNPQLQLIAYQRMGGEGGRVPDYLMPMEGNEALFRPAAAAGAEQAAALRRACETGKVSMTAQHGIMLGNAIRPGFMLLMPVYRAGGAPAAGAAGCAAVDGYTIAGVGSEVLFAQSLARTRLVPEPSFDIRVYQDAMADPARLVFHLPASPGSAPSALARLLGGPAHQAGESFELAGRRWHVAIAAPPAPLLPGSLGSLLMLAGGIGASVLGAAYAGMLAARTRSVHRLVKQRTEDLKLANRAQRLLRQAVDACANGIIILRATAPDYPIEYVNPAFEKLSGYSAAEVAGRNCAMLWDDDVDQPGVRELGAMVRERREGTAVLRTYRKDGSLLWSEVVIAPVRDAAGAVTHFVVANTDVTEQRRYESQLEFQANHDVLTGLVNGKLLAERLRQEIDAAAPRADAVWVLLVDLDRFKFVNDSVGHRAGDECLQVIARRLAMAVRLEDTVARLGGDEFTLVLSGRGAGPLEHAVLERIMAAVACPVSIGSQEFFLSCSVGVASYPADGDDPEKLIEYADLAMYRAKQLGRCNYQLFRPEMNQQVQERTRLESALRSALGRGEFELHYQPQLDLRSGRVVGVEALLRWRHPELGLLLPPRFLALAEDTGLILPIGNWAMRSACAQVRAWQLAGACGLRLAFNLAARQFNEPDLIGQVEQVLDETGLAPACLELELTERMVMADVGRAVAALNDLRALGVSIAVDDFGTGSSSLAQLNDFPLDALKIDHSFVHAISGNGNDAAISNAIISLAHNLGMRVIAEGVETEAQCEFLARNMCDEIQGNLFSPAQDAAAIGALLAEARALPAHLLRLHKRQRTLLLVDDEPNILSALKRQLRGTGLRILTASSGLEGLALLDAEPVDVIVSDQRMPGMTGVDFLRAVKTSHPETVRIVLSGFTELQSVTDAVNEGAIYKFLTKPWDDAQLRGHIEEAIRSKEMADENLRLDLEVRTANHGLAQANRRLEGVLSQQQELIDSTGISLDIVREALHHMPLPIVGLDEEQVVAFANLAAQEQFSAHGMLLGSAAALFMPQLLAALDQAGDGHACIALLHGSRYQVDAHSMGKDTRSRGRLIIFKPAPAVLTDREKTA